MRKAVREKAANKQATSKPAFIPSPTKGWYVGDNLSEAPPGTAYILDNAFPQLDYVRMRGGSVAYATGMANAAVSTLMPYNGASASKFFSVCSGSIFDVSSAGAVGAAAVTGLNSSANMEFIQYTNAGGSWIIAVNGVDPAQLYNGTAWVTAPAITGLTGGNLAFVWSCKNHIYGIQAASLNAWYLATDSIGGAATSFPLSSIFKYGGYLQCGTEWAINATNGLYLLNVFISSEGEIAIYDGLSPADATWKILGTYKVSKPLGRRCLLKAGGDVAVMTEDGIVPLSKVMQLDQIALQNVAVTKPIAPAWRNAVLARQGLSGWQVKTWPRESMGIINLPKVNAGDKTQFIANVRTGAWAQYLGWDANCFEVYNNNLYYGTSDGRVMQAETGGQDDGGNYTMTVFPSYSDLGSPASTKHVKMVRPRIQSAYSVKPQITVKTDFDTTKPAQPTASSPAATGALWDTAVWDTATWPPALTDLSFWTDAEGFGATVSPVIQLTLSTSITPDVRMTAIEMLYETGNPLG
jgi:hypothetical protein